MLCNKCKSENYLAGQGFRDWECKYCGETFTHHNTTVPKYCPECSELLGVCEQCGELLPNIELHNCLDCKYHYYDGDCDGEYEYVLCCKGHEYSIDYIFFSFNCPDFEKD